MAAQLTPHSAESSSDSTESKEPKVDSTESPIGAPIATIPAAILAMVSGVLYWAAFPGIDVWPLAFICWAPLLIALRHQTPRRALWLGALQGLTCNVIGFYWLLGMLRTFSGFPTILCMLFMLILCGYQGGRMALMSWLYARASRLGWSAGLTFVLALAASELVYPLLFPWYTAAQTHTVPALMQLADIGGPILIGVALAGGSVAIAELVWARMDRRRIDRWRLGLAIAGPLLMIAYGIPRLRAVDSRIASSPSAKIGVAQGNLALSGTEHRDGAAIHRGLSAKLESSAKPDLIVWPETAVNYSIPDSVLKTRAARLVLSGPVVDETGGGLVILRTPVLTGLIIRRGGVARGTGKEFNSATLVEADGSSTGVYDKTFLLAFGEYIPFGDWFPQLYDISKNSGNLTKGTSLEALPFRDHRITTLICYEDILPTFTNLAVRHADPDLLVNITNDAWFGKSTEPAIHLALAKFRAVEHRRFLVRATNSGVSAFVDPNGRSFGETPIFEQATTSGTIRWMRSTTAYEVVGDMPWWAATIAVVAMGYVRAPKRRRTRS